ncbi:MAG: ABC-2 family transporter protein [Chloroflexi bacterium]|nr:ABC-2 family transporter protein [Chloroflexota bacterium]MBI3734438.1 ABC-2 family transporter protein [Chloroflexota bacterium]
MRLIRLRPYWKTAAMEAAGAIGDDPLFLLQYLFRLLRVLVLLSIWQVIFAGRGAVAGMSAASVLTYTLIEEVFADPLTTRTELWVSLRDGSLAVSFLQPMGLVGQFTSKMIGRWFFGSVTFSLPLLMLSPLLGVSPMPASAAALALFVISLVLAITVGVALEFIFGGLMVYFEYSTYAIENLRSAVSVLLSGALIPLQLMPWGMGEVLRWLPFASVASAPLTIYTGTGDPLFLLVMQALWAVILWPVAGWLWRLNRERLVSFGG